VDDSWSVIHVRAADICCGVKGYVASEEWVSYMGITCTGLGVCKERRGEERRG
jgi:hypothetical protein